MNTFEKSVVSLAALLLVTQVGMVWGVYSGAKLAGSEIAALKEELDKRTIWDLFMDQSQDYSKEAWLDWVWDKFPEIDVDDDEINDWWDEMSIWNVFDWFDEDL